MDPIYDLISKHTFVYYNWSYAQFIADHVIHPSSNNFFEIIFISSSTPDDFSSRTSFEVNRKATSLGKRKKAGSEKVVATDVSRGWLEGGKTRVNSTAWIGRNARESTFRGKWEYPGSNGASGPVIVSRLSPWGNRERATEKRCPRAR